MLPAAGRGGQGRQLKGVQGEPCNTFHSLVTNFLRVQLPFSQVLSDDYKIYALKRIKLARTDKATMMSYKNEVPPEYPLTSETLSYVVLNT